MRTVCLLTNMNFSVICTALQCHLKYKILRNIGFYNAACTLHGIQATATVHWKCMCFPAPITYNVLCTLQKPLLYTMQQTMTYCQLNVLLCDTKHCKPILPHHCYLGHVPEQSICRLRPALSSMPGCLAKRLLLSWQLHGIANAMICSVST